MDRRPREYLVDLPLFRDRVEAGARLAARLDPYRGARPLVLGVPRGGVPVADEVALQLDTELDVVVARKLGAPFSRELAIGAVTANGGCYLNQQLIDELGISDAYLEQVVAAETAEARRREERFRDGRPPVKVAGRTVLIVDDGLATGATVRAAVRSVRQRQPGQLVVAVPVGSREACAALRLEADAVVCLYEPDPFWAVGLYYRHFEAVEDAEVQHLLARAATRQAARPPAS